MRSLRFWMIWAAVWMPWVHTVSAAASEGVLVLVDVQVKPGEVEQVVERFHRSQQRCATWDGCQRFEVTVSADDPNHVVVVEQWRSIEAHKAVISEIFQSDSFRDFRKLLLRDLEFRYLEVR